MSVFFQTICECQSSSFAYKEVWMFRRITITFLALDVVFVVICVAVASLIGIAVCFCLPCIIAILYVVTDQVGTCENVPFYST